MKSTSSPNEFIDAPGLLDKFQSPQMHSNRVEGIEIAAALRRAVETPILFPPLKESVFAGDKVAIVLQPNLPHANAVVESLVEILSQLDIASDDVCVVISESTAESLGIAPEDYRLPQETRSDAAPPMVPITFGFQTIEFQVHDPDNPTGLAYLAANADGEPVYINRRLVDADFVLTLASPLPGDPSRLADTIYPAFSGVAAQQRYADGMTFGLRQEAELANDMLGSFFVIQLVCGPGNLATEVIAGVRQQATDQARLATNENWRFEFDQPAATVVATVESDSEDQNWDSFADAVRFANQFIQGDGPIVIWSELDLKPNKFARAACNLQFQSEPLPANTPDRFRQLGNILSERPVFLRSRLKRNQVEALGLGYLESLDEVIRVTEPFEDRLLIRDAHRCQRG